MKLYDDRRKTMKVISGFNGPYRFLSNFWPCIVHMDEKAYPSVEHAYQAAKTLDFNERYKISQLRTSGKAKRMGRNIILRPNWEEIKISTMFSLLRLKFSQPQLTKLLLDTKNEVLIEGNKWGDTFWGICNNKGENKLGILLMMVRDEIRKNR